MQLQGTNTYIVGTGPERLLIDTGQGNARWAESIRSLTEKHGFKICSVLLTHWHLDHTEGVPDLLKMNPDLTGAIYKHDPDPSQRPIADGQIFSVEGATLNAVFTPGHTADHMCFFLQEEEAVFTGDTILGHGATATEDLGQYMQSLSKLSSLNCRAGYPGHGAVIASLAQKLQQEVRVKLRREQLLLRALEDLRLDKGGVTQAELTESVYGQLPTDSPTALVERYVSEILMKLATEKRVGFKLQGGQKLWFVHRR